MAYNLIVTLRAENDINAAVEYYDDVTKALGDRFLAAVDIAYDKILANPGYYKYINRKDKGYRCIRLKDFPFLIIFRINGDKVVVASVLNTYKKNRFL